MESQNVYVRFEYMMQCMGVAGHIVLLLRGESLCCIPNQQWPENCMMYDLPNSGPSGFALGIV